MKNIKKAVALALSLTITVTAGSAAVCAETLPAASGGLKSAYLREDIKVEYNRELLAFKDEQGNAVYPITFAGNTYLPIRAVSGLMGEPIEWISRAKTVYIGKTLTAPIKSITSKQDSPYVEFLMQEQALNDADNNEIAEAVSSNSTATLPGSGKRSVITVREQKNIYVMYDFEQIELLNEKGDVIYPINYNGSNYLPIRAIAALMDEDIVWDGNTNTVYIGSMEKVDPSEQDSVREETLAIQELFNKEADVYNRATANIAGIAGWTNETAPQMAAAISENLIVAQTIKNEAAELLDKYSFTEEEAEAVQKLYDFVEVTEYYILVMENIAYMEALGQDYSMLAKTFLDFALASDKAMETAMSAIEGL